MPVCVSSAVGRMWHTGGGSLALSDPGKLCHPIIIPSLTVGSQLAHCSGDNHHGDRLSGLCGSCQREPASTADSKLTVPLTLKKKAVLMWWCHFPRLHFVVIGIEILNFLLKWKLYLSCARLNYQLSKVGSCPGAPNTPSVKIRVRHGK